MRDELRERRERTWELLVVMGVSYTDTVQRISQEFDVAEGTIKSDISRMENWVGELDVSYYSGVSRLREMRQARQRLRQYEMQAQSDEDYQLAAKINEKYWKNVRADLRVSQRLGLTNEEPHEIEVADGLDPEDEDLLDEFCGVEGEAVDLEEMA